MKLRFVVLAPKQSPCGFVLGSLKYPNAALFTHYCCHLMYVHWFGCFGLPIIRFSNHLLLLGMCCVSDNHLSMIGISMSPAISLGHVID